MTKLMQLVEKHFPRIELVCLPRKDFNDEDGKKTQQTALKKKIVAHIDLIFYRSFLYQKIWGRRKCSITITGTLYKVSLNKR